MVDSHGGGDLIAAIYDAIIEPSRWDKVVKRIVDATKSVSGFLLVRSADAAQLAAMCNCDPFYANAYVQTWYKQNPIDAFAATIAPGKLGTATHISQTDSYRSSAFHNEIIRPQGWADVVGVGLVRGPKSWGHLVLPRSAGAMWVEEAEWHLLETLAPHLRRATAIHQLLSRARTTTDSLAAAVAAAGFAVFLLTEDCRILFANTKAEDLVRRGASLRAERGRLAAAAPALTHRLHALAREAARPASAEGDIGGTLELPRGEDRPPLVAHVVPLAAIRTVAIFDLDRPACALFIVDPSADLGIQVRRFATRFGLTTAEARVLREIIAGDGLFAAARKLKITKATARTHAQHIFDKTGTHRQSELIRRFFATSLPGSPAT